MSTLEAGRESVDIESAGRMKISVVTPTLLRPREVEELLENLSRQTLLPEEVVLVDGADSDNAETKNVVERMAESLPFRCLYIRGERGTAVQRNVGIDAATGDFVAFIDDDIRLEPDFFERVAEVFEQDREGMIGGVAGYISNCHLDPSTSRRWKWYRRLGFFKTYEPGRYDFQSGYPINRYLQPPHDGVREIDFMGAGCAVWRAAVFADSLRFSPFFTGFGVLEDAHLALRAGRRWKLVESGVARCSHLRSEAGRIDNRRLARKTAVNYRYVFVDLVPRRTLDQELRFWRVQVFDLLCYFAYALRYPSKSRWSTAIGKLEGILSAVRVSRKRAPSEHYEVTAPIGE